MGTAEGWLIMVIKSRALSSVDTTKPVLHNRLFWVCKYGSRQPTPNTTICLRSSLCKKLSQEERGHTKGHPWSKAEMKTPRGQLHTSWAQGWTDLSGCGACRKPWRSPLPQLLWPAPAAAAFSLELPPHAPAPHGEKR